MSAILFWLGWAIVGFSLFCTAVLLGGWAYLFIIKAKNRREPSFIVLTRPLAGIVVGGFIYYLSTVIH